MRVEEEKKKESWMDKLIELLNEYKKLGKYKEYWYNWKQVKLIKYAEDYAESTSEDVTEKIISKKYWFIKWLVDNGKMDWRKFLGLWYEIAVIDWRWEDTYILETFDDYEQLLMYLAIQDEPISFLISILN